jgi:hypothetical protein
VRRCDPSELRQFAAALRPGAVLHLYQSVAGKDKFHVLVAASDHRSIGFLVNTRPSQFVARQPELMHRQVPMPQKAHRFMHHDSFIACHDIVALPTRGDLIDGLLNRGIDHVGHIDMALYRQMANAAAGSALIAQRDAELIVSAFGR